MVESRPSKPLVASSNLVSRSIRAHIAQSAEHFLGKEEVTDSSSVVGYTPLAQLVEQRIPNP